MPLHDFFATMIRDDEVGERPPWSRMGPIENARSLFEENAFALGPGPDVEDVRDVLVPGRNGAVPCRLYTPANPPEATIVYAHGGGWILGGLDSFDALAREIAVRGRSRVILADYALAPERPFPGGLRDVEEVIRWAAAESATPLIVAGDSAGANLVAAAVGEVSPAIPIALQLLIYPVTDCDFGTPSHLRHGRGPFLTTEDMIWFFRQYAPEELWADPRISVFRRDDLASIPPTWVATAEYDPLRDEGEAFAAKIKAAGVPVRLRRYPGLVHGFIRMHRLIDTAEEALGDAMTAVHTAIERYDAGAGHR